MINRSPWLWGVRKTAAGLTGRTSLGIQILQGKRAPGQSNPSPEFLQAQAATRVITPIYQAIAAVIKAGFLQKGPGQSSYNLFYKYTYDNALDLASPGVAVLEAENVLVSKGVMTLTPYSTAPVADASARTVTVSWNATPANDTQLSTDLISVAVHNASSDTWFGEPVIVARSAGTFALNVPDGFMDTGDGLDVYMAFRGEPSAANAGTSSNSVNQQVIVVA